MAAFKVLQDFAITPDHEVKHLSVGAVYMPGHDITGLMAAEAGELLLLAPEGTFEPLDAEAQTVAGWAARKRAESETTLGLVVEVPMEFDDGDGYTDVVSHQVLNTPESEARAKAYEAEEGHEAPTTKTLKVGGAVKPSGSTRTAKGGA